jgi:hypothetical protein
MYSSSSAVLLAWKHLQTVYSGQFNCASRLNNLSVDGLGLGMGGGEVESVCDSKSIDTR